MRRVAQFALVICCVSSLRAEGFGPNLTVLLDFEVSPSASSVQELKREVSQIMERTGHNVEVKLRSDVAPAEDFEDLVLVKFRGSCDMTVFAPLIDERGPLAWTHTVQGEIQPFSEVGCNGVRRAVAAALWGGERKRQDELFGRALGRVVAHELYHIVYKTGAHDKAGVFKQGLSAHQLIADQFESSKRNPRNAFQRSSRP